MFQGHLDANITDISMVK